MKTRLSSTPEQQRWNLLTTSPVGALRVVAHTAAIVGVYHADHSPPPPEDLLGRPATASDVPVSAGTHSAATLDTSGSVPAFVAPEATTALLQQGAAELDQYFAGERRHFDVPVELRGTDFQRRVWAVLMDIPYGQRRSYGELAEHLGNASMGRAIGAAVRANPISIIVPGHRVVGSTGAVLGYAAGTGTKRALLEGESAQLPERQPADTRPGTACPDAPPPSGHNEESTR